MTPRCNQKQCFRIEKNKHFSNSKWQDIQNNINLLPTTKERKMFRYTFENRIAFTLQRLCLQQRAEQRSNMFTETEKKHQHMHAEVIAFYFQILIDCVLLLVVFFFVWEIHSEPHPSIALSDCPNCVVTKVSVNCYREITSQLPKLRRLFIIALLNK